MFRALPAMVLGLVFAEVAVATTVRYNIVPASNRTARTRTVQTGSQIEYFVTAEVLSDETELDSDGLSLFTVNVLTNLEVTQPAATEFIQFIRQTFTLFPSLGTPVGDNIEGIGASQSTFGSARVITGVGQSGPQELVRGFLQTPDREGTFVVSIDRNSSANVLRPNFAVSGGVRTATIEVGGGFTIITDDDAPVDPGSGGAGGGLSEEEKVAAAATSAGIFGASTIGGLLFGGPVGAAFGMYIGSILGLLSLIFGGLFGAPAA